MSAVLVVVDFLVQVVHTWRDAGSRKKRRKATSWEDATSVETKGED